MATPDFAPDREENFEYAPCFIYDTERDLAEEQLSRNDPLTVNGELNLLDISTYLRGRIKAADAVTRRDAEPAESETDGKQAPSQPTEPPPPNSESKASASLESSSDGEPIARRQGTKVPVGVPDDS